MGEVYKAFDPVLDRTVALKTISSISDDPLLLQRLYIEARACGRLAHPNIVRVYDLHESASAVYISMEYLEGESLAAAMERGTLPLAHKLQILDEILSALHYAHTHNVIHRDVKPSNVHLAPDGHIKLLDFGLARMTVGPTMTTAGSVMGTAPYMSPEQLKAQGVDGRDRHLFHGRSRVRVVDGASCVRRREHHRGDVEGAVRVSCADRHGAPWCAAGRSRAS
jgi:serine/threonine-protein kinase